MPVWLGITLGTLYILLLIAAAEALRHWRGYGPEFTRKLIHIGVGMMNWWIVYVFATPWPFIALCLVFVLINFLDLRFGFFAAMTSSDRSNLGTVYFPLASAVVAYYLWSSPPLFVAAMMSLTWGDGLAAVIGRRYGKRLYHAGAVTKSVEGSAAFFVAGFLATWLALWALPGEPSITPMLAVAPAALAVGLATLLEAVTRWGLDNLTVTAAATAVLMFWPF